MVSFSHRRRIVCVLHLHYSVCLSVVVCLSTFNAVLSRVYSGRKQTGKQNAKDRAAAVVNLRTDKVL